MLEVDFGEAVYALDATTINLSMNLFPWAHFRSTESAVKLHTLLDLRGNIPTFIDRTPGKTHEEEIELRKQELSNTRWSYEKTLDW